MTLLEAFSLITRQAPCPHDNVDTNLGNGKVWCKCDDCGQTVAQDSIPRAKAAFDKFTSAIEFLNELADETITLRAALQAHGEEAAKLMAERDELLAVLKACDEAMEYMSEYDIPLTLPDMVKKAITNATTTERK